MSLTERIALGGAAVGFVIGVAVGAGATQLKWTGRQVGVLPDLRDAIGYKPGYTDLFSRIVGVLEGKKLL